MNPTSLLMIFLPRGLSNGYAMEKQDSFFALTSCIFYIYYMSLKIGPLLLPEFFCRLSEIIW